MNTQWQTKKIKFCDTVIMGQSPDGKSVNSDGEGLPFLQGNAEFSDLYPVAIHATTEPGKLCEGGDILLSVRAPVGAVNVADKTYAIGRGLCAIRPVSHARTFLRYLLKTKTEVLNSIATGTTFTAVSVQQVGNIEVEIPPLFDQQRVANYLDEQTAKIDRLLEMRRRQMELLKEQRSALIQQAVTRGLNPDAPMKDSGIPWLGDIPAHWRCAPLRRFWSVTDCKHLTVPFLDEGYPLASVTEVQTFELDLSQAKRTSEEFWKILIEGDRQPQVGDLIYCRNTSVGAAGYVSSDEPIAMGQDVCLIRSKHQNNRYLNYVLRSGFMADQLNTILVGATFKRINVADIKALIVLCPPRSEQDEITSFIEAQNAKIDATIFAYTRQLTLLAEYRAALIHECVTGQREVPNGESTLTPTLSQRTRENYMEGITHVL